MWVVSNCEYGVSVYQVQFLHYTANHDSQTSFRHKVPHTCLPSHCMSYSRCPIICFAGTSCPVFLYCRKLQDSFLRFSLSPRKERNKSARPHQTAKSFTHLFTLPLLLSIGSKRENEKVDTRQCVQTLSVKVAPPIMKRVLISLNPFFISAMPSSRVMLGFHNLHAIAGTSHNSRNNDGTDAEGELVKSEI